VRDTRVLARTAVGYVRDGAQAPEAVVIAVRELSVAVRELAAEAQHADLATTLTRRRMRRSRSQAAT
jgi:hypothetical protein